MEIRHIKGENASVAKATMSMMYDHLCNCVASSDCETETETIYSAQSRETSAANEIKSEVESNQEEDESDEDKETDYDIAEYEPESCNEAERPPQVRPDTGRFSSDLLVCRKSRLHIKVDLSIGQRISTPAFWSRFQCETDQYVISARSLDSFL